MCWIWSMLSTESVGFPPSRVNGDVNLHNMYVTCKCLNVTIRTRSNKLKPVNIDDFELNPIEREDLFFREKLASITGLEGITKEQSALVELRNVGPWIVYYCRNCSVYTHAIHEEYGAASVIVNTSIIMSLNEVEKLKASPNRSPIFGIVIDRDPLDVDLLQPSNEFLVSQLSRSQQLALARLQQQLEDKVQKESTATEEKIRVFTEEQYQLLEQFRETAHAEYTLLARLIYNSEDGDKFLNNTLTLRTNTPERVKSDATTSLAQSVDPESPDPADNDASAEMSIEHESETRHPDYQSRMERIAGTRANSYRYLYAGFLYNRDGKKDSYRCACRTGSASGCPGRVKEDSMGNVIVVRPHNHRAIHAQRERIAMRNEMINLIRTTDMMPREIFNLVCSDERFSDAASGIKFSSIRSTLWKEKAKFRTPKLTENLSDVGICSDPCSEEEPTFATS